MRRIILAVIIPAGVLASIAGIALATPGSGITSVNVSVGRFGEIDVKTETETHEVELRTREQSDIFVVSNTFAPGGDSGWHTHPGPSLITVKSGTITAYSGDDPSCTPHVYPAGSGFVDPGGHHVHLLRNEGSVEAVTIAVQVLPAGAVRRIDAPDPGNCDF